MKVKNEYGVEFEWDTIVICMDSDVARKIEHKYGYIDDEQDYFNAYLATYPKVYNGEQCEWAKTNPCW